MVPFLLGRRLNFYFLLDECWRIPRTHLIFNWIPAIKGFRHIEPYFRVVLLTAFRLLEMRIFYLVRHWVFLVIFVREEVLCSPALIAWGVLVVHWFFLITHRVEQILEMNVFERLNFPDECSVLGRLGHLEERKYGWRLICSQWLILTPSDYIDCSFEHRRFPFPLELARALLERYFWWSLLTSHIYLPN